MAISLHRCNQSPPQLENALILPPSNSNRKLGSYHISPSPFANRHPFGLPTPSDRDNAVHWILSRFAFPGGHTSFGTTYFRHLTTNRPSRYQSWESNAISSYRRKDNILSFCILVTVLLLGIWNRWRWNANRDGDGLAC